MLKEFIKNKSGGKDDCFAAALSFVTGIPREGVPNFIQHEDFNAAMDCYLYAWDLKMEVYDPNTYPDIENVLYFGVNESGNQHVVVSDNKDKLVYDSYPKGGGLIEVTDKRVITPYNNNMEIDCGC